MCLTNASEKLVAKSNIICFKTGESRIPLFEGYRSGFKEFRYKRFKVQPKVEMDLRISRYDDSRRVERAYHSFRRFGLSIFIIPKGSEYYKGYFNGDKHVQNYASDSIIWIGSTFNPINWLIALIYKLK